MWCLEDVSGADDNEHSKLKGINKLPCESGYNGWAVGIGFYGTAPLFLTAAD